MSVGVQVAVNGSVDRVIHVPGAGCTVSTEDVIRHFLACEASGKKYKDRKEEIESWCGFPDEQLRERARRFSEERDDTNPLLEYTVGHRSREMVKWTRERIQSADVYTCGIADGMSEDLVSVAGNVQRFALEKATKYDEFANGYLPPESVAIIVIKQANPKREGSYELVDGAHRLVALCRAGVEAVEAFVGHCEE